ncbi:MAG: hypothetical protein BWY28_03280 [bacterium ADurb.Bin236]|nr:MAG: hypothetical protein BWY28_03280 [bacterium ADurb.Bin236]
MKPRAAMNSAAAPAAPKNADIAFSLNAASPNGKSWNSVPNCAYRGNPGGCAAPAPAAASANAPELPNVTVGAIVAR